LSLGKDQAGVKKLIDGLEAEARALIKEISNISVWSGNQIESVWHMPFLERQILSEVIKEKVDLLYGKNGIARARL
jgi:hypothetical protein